MKLSTCNLQKGTPHETGWICHWNLVCRSKEVNLRVLEDEVRRDIARGAEAETLVLAIECKQKRLLYRTDEHLVEVILRIVREILKLRSHLWLSCFRGST